MSSDTPIEMKKKSWVSMPIVILSMVLGLGFGQCSNKGNEHLFEQLWDQTDDKDEGVYQDMGQLTRNFTTLPSSRDLTGYIDSHLAPTPNLCEHQGSRASLDGDYPLIGGARRMLATYFQSCTALDKIITAQTPPLQGVRSATNINGKTSPFGRNARLRQITNNAAMVRGHIVLGELMVDPTYPEAPHCRDMTQTPPIYGYGSRLSRTRSNTINLFTAGQGVVTPPEAVGVDCSAFVSAAFAASGLRLRKGGPPFQDLTTVGFRDLALNAQSCVRPADFDAEASIKPGDLVNFSGNHIIMIDTVSEDPLGIKRHASANSCGSLSISDFDFTYIHSGALKGSYGPSRVHSSTHNGGTLFNNLLLTARAQCQRMARSQMNATPTHTLNPVANFGILRHRSHDPDCRLEERIPLEGEACVEKCFNPPAAEPGPEVQEPDEPTELEDLEDLEAEEYEDDDEYAVG
jgi:hypothetical protein